MTWFNEFECFFLFLLIMKLALLWAVAAYVAAADLPCEEYCVCISTGIRTIAHQPECNCLKGGLQPLAELDDSGIYYEPAEYFPAPTFFYGQPFIIINPYFALRKHALPHNTPHYTNPNNQIEINIDNSTSHRRKEKDTESLALNNKITSIYLDIDVPDDNERSASSVLTPEELQLTERDLIECVNLYTVLDYRKHRNPDLLNARSPGPFAKYDHQSDADLMSKIDSKCSQIADIVQRSLKEIKEKRPKKTDATFRMLNEEYGSNSQHDNEPLITTEKIVDATTASLESLNNFNSEDTGRVEEDATKEENVVFIYTDSASEEYVEENQVTLQTLSPKLTSTGVSFVTDAPTITEISSITSPPNDSTYNTTEYPFHTETTPLLTPSSSTYDTGSTNTDQNFAESRRANDQYNNTDTKSYEGRKEGRNENKVPLIKIITKEFKNNTVESFINGTENTYNSDFDFDVENRSGEDTTTYFNENIETSTLKDSTRDKSPDLIGNLYFLYNKHHIPAKFVQKPNGTMHLGIDGESLCDQVAQDGDHRSAILTTLCKCYKTGNCPDKK